ncbi:MAG: hypothetical protein R3314_10925 [Longimicrobiales bacterium]|nr:hypothetical protein [Longimicrobiales bacterium]
MGSRVWNDGRRGVPGPVYARAGGGPAREAGRRGDRSGAAAGLGLVVAAAVLLLAGPAEAQRAAGVGAFVEVPAVAQLDVQPVAVSGGETGERSGLLRIRVRANHTWKLMVTAVPGAGVVEVRSSGTGHAATHRLQPGSETSIAAGGRGSFVLEVEYRWDSGARATELPFTYTLASG